MIRKFTEFLNEDAATPSNVPGMGDICPPSENEEGSGDVYINGSFKKKKTLEELEKEANEKLDEKVDIPVIKKREKYKLDIIALFDKHYGAVSGNDMKEIFDREHKKRYPGY